MFDYGEYSGDHCGSISYRIYGADGFVQTTSTGPVAPKDLIG